MSIIYQGKQQSTLLKFRSELQVNIEVDYNTRLMKVCLHIYLSNYLPLTTFTSIQLSGSADQVANAKTVIFEYLLTEISKNYAETIYIPFAAVPKLIGVKG